MNLASALQRLLTHTMIAPTGVAIMAAASESRAEPCPSDATAFQGTYVGLKYHGCEGSLDGVPYLIYLPEGWQPGAPLLVNMYGYVPTLGKLDLKPVYDRRARPWLALGYAVVVSRSTQGWVPHQRMFDTEKLRQYFIQQFGGGKQSLPSVISGFSMGGMQAYHVIEKPDTPYDGALILCGFGVPSLKYLQEYVFNTRLLFDAEFPDELPGSVVDFPDEENTMKNACQKLREAIPDGPDEPVAGLVCLPATGRAPSRLLDRAKLERYMRSTSTPRIGQIPAKVALDSELLRELFRGSGDKNIFDNTKEIYPDKITRVLTIPRYSAEAKFDQEVVVTGNIGKPVLAMHTMGDECVPFKLAKEYEDLVGRQGKADNFVLLQTTRSGHCNFTDAELGGALSLLDEWIKSTKKAKGTRGIEKEGPAARPKSGDFTDGFHTPKEPS